MKTRKESWMTNEVLTKVVRKNELYVEWKTTEVNDRNYEMIKLSFKNHEKEVSKDITNAKKNYFNRIFNAYKIDMKKTCRPINKTLSKDIISSQLPSIFYHNDLELTNPTEIADAFNMHFSNIGKDLAAEIEKNITKDNDFTQYLTALSLTKCKFRCVTQAEIIQAIDNLENKNSFGLDGMSNKLLKFIKYEIISSLTLIVNQMITTGIFPDSFKNKKNHTFI